MCLREMSDSGGRNSSPKEPTFAECSPKMIRTAHPGVPSESRARSAKGSTPMILIVVKHPVRPEFADDWTSLVAEFTTATRAEPGNISFDWYRSPEDANEWLLVEAFRDGEAGQAHVRSAHFQAAVAALPKWLAAAVEAVRKQRYTVASRESLKRVPRGFDADHPRAELLKLKGMHVGREFGAPKWLHSAGALDKIVTAWRAAAPVNRWLDRHVGPSTEAPPEPD